MTLFSVPCNVADWMRYIVLFLCAWVLCSCALPFIGNKTPVIRPQILEVQFASSSATADLKWDLSVQSKFYQYQVQRSRSGRDFQTVAKIVGRLDTTYRDSSLLANTTYRYRVVTEHTGYQDDEGNFFVISDTVSGGIHQFANAWSLPKGFLPTRIAIDESGIVYVVGAGAGWVERFDRHGNSLSRWHFADQPNACLETGTLDGPAIALDEDSNLFVVFNVLPAMGPPSPRWSKFDSQGKMIWSHSLEAAFVRHLVVDGDHVFIETISQLQQFKTDGTYRFTHHVPALLVSSLRSWRGYFAALVEPLDFSEIGWRAPRLVFYKSAERQEVDIVLGRDPLSQDDRGAGLLARPSDFAFDPDKNRIYIVNAGHGRIEVFKDEDYLTRWALSDESEPTFQFSGIATVVDDLENGATRERRVVAGGIAIDANGYIYVADTFNNQIQKFDP